MHWFETHVGSMETALEQINKLKWHLRVIQDAKGWYVTTGEAEQHVIFSSEKKEVVDVFIYGMALAYMGIPDLLFDELVTDVGEWYDSL